MYGGSDLFRLRHIVNPESVLLFVEINEIYLRIKPAFISRYIKTELSLGSI